MIVKETLHRSPTWEINTLKLSLYNFPYVHIVFASSLIVKEVWCSKIWGHKHKNHIQTQFTIYKNFQVHGLKSKNFQNLHT